VYQRNRERNGVWPLRWHEFMKGNFAAKTFASEPRATSLLLAQLVYSGAMKCPFCRTDNDRVCDSRACQDGYSIRRRRQCLKCRRRYTTYERIEESTIKVVKRDGSRVPFSREKVKHGLERACWKRPISDRDIERTVAAIENDVYTSFDLEIESRRLGELVMEHLRDLDEVAFVRFASVYRQFADAGDFVDEIRPLLAKGGNNHPR
jgi:transcriptional repressor NrdR